MSDNSKKKCHKKEKKSSSEKLDDVDPSIKLNSSNHSSGNSIEHAGKHKEKELKVAVASGKQENMKHKPKKKRKERDEDNPQNEKEDGETKLTNSNVSNEVSGYIKENTKKIKTKKKNKKQKKNKRDKTKERKNDDFFSPKNSVESTIEKKVAEYQEAEKQKDETQLKLDLEGGDARMNKFLRLMGAKKSHNSNTQVKQLSQVGQIQKNLENQFSAALDMNNSRKKGKKIGLGA